MINWTIDWSIRQQIDTSIDVLIIYTTLELEYINVYYYISSDTFYFLYQFIIFFSM